MTQEMPPIERLELSRAFILIDKSWRTLQIFVMEKDRGKNVCDVNYLEPFPLAQ